MENQKPMCTNPSYIYLDRAGVPTPTPVACRQCWQCKQNRTNDYVGRCLAEASTSEWCVTVTLTYATPDPKSDHPLAHKIITPVHWQKFIRALRKRGHKLRYLTCGEYGETKGRAHFHAILFGNGKRPDFEQGKYRNYPVWPHGFLYADWTGSEKAIRYVCKYITKDLDKTTNEQAWFSVSRKPPLGHEWFKKKALHLIKNGVLPRSFEYTPPGGDSEKTYLMTGATRRDFLRLVVRGFMETRDLDKKRLSEWVAKSMEADEKVQFREWHEQFTKDYSTDEYIADLMENLERVRPNDRSVARALIDTSFLDDV